MAKPEDQLKMYIICVSSVRLDVGKRHCTSISIVQVALKGTQSFQEWLSLPNSTLRGIVCQYAVRRREIFRTQCNDCFLISTHRLSSAKRPFVMLSMVTVWVEKICCSVAWCLAILVLAVIQQEAFADPPVCII